MYDTEKYDATIEIIDLAIKGVVMDIMKNRPDENIGKGIESVLKLAAKAGLIGDQEDK